MKINALDPEFYLSKEKLAILISNGNLLAEQLQRLLDVPGQAFML